MPVAGSNSVAPTDDRRVGRPEEELERVRIDARLRVGDLRDDRRSAARERRVTMRTVGGRTSFTHERSVYRPASERP